jgi:hypothetical protein
MNDPPLFVYLLTGAFMLVGLLLLGFYWYERRKALASRSWPTATAEITSSQIIGTRRRKGGAMYRPSISYRYDVGGRTLTGTRIQWGGQVSSSSESWARGIVERFPQGALVQVHYDPANPDNAVLDPDGRAGLWIIAAAGLAFAAFSTVFMLIARSGD